MPRKFINVLVFMLLAVFLVQIPGLHAQKKKKFLRTLKEGIRKVLYDEDFLKRRDTEDIPSNITVITAEIIERRGYQNLVEVCRDVPGFDFAAYEDGGEYPTHNSMRGIGGDPGNPKILIMVDGIMQNFVNFNWSVLWTNEMIMHDIEKIEIIQGPGAAEYGFNDYAGIISIITKSDFEGIYAEGWIGQNNSRNIGLSFGREFNGYNLSLSFRKYNSDGDGGDRYDPGGYYHDIVSPYVLTQQYDDKGNYYILYPQFSTGGDPLRDGFRTNRDDTAFRVKVSSSNSEFGLHVWDKKDGLGSYVPGYEYYTNTPGKQYKVHHRGYNFYGKNILRLSDRFTLKSLVYYRVTRQMPKTGFVYTYKFNGLPKTFHSSSSQGAIEEQLRFKVNDDHSITGGVRFMTSLKTPQVVSLGQIQDGLSSTTGSSYAIASNGDGLYNSETVTTQNSLDYSGYIVWNAQIERKFFTSVGIRYDNNSEYGSVTNPRIGLTFRGTDNWTGKLIYGSAFRQPGIFEQTDEFRGNKDIKPEKISTYEIENSLEIARDYKIRANVFYSDMSDKIGVVADASRPAGERYDNMGTSRVRGLSVVGDAEPYKNISLYCNYIYTEGKEGDGDWDEMEHVARHKLNFGANANVYEGRLNINLRMNYVGKTKAPASNKWMWRNENGYAPAYFVSNLVVTFNDLFKNANIAPQLIVNNLLDTEYYSLGRQAGSGDIGFYNPVLNPNPAGFIPAYHPQPGRTVMLNIRFLLE